MVSVADVPGGAVGDAVAGEEVAGDEVPGEVGPGDVVGATVHAASASATSSMNVPRVDLVGRLTRGIVAHRQLRIEPMRP